MWRAWPMSVILCKENSNRIEVTVSADIAGECLKISGQTIENARREMRRAEKYLYSYAFDKHNTQRLYKVLSNDNGESSLMDLVVKNFSGMNGCRTLREICEENNISYSFSSN
jgi:hypothetical protein